MTDEWNENFPSAQKKKKFFLAIDTEQIGKNFKYPIIAIGAVFGDDEGNIIRTGIFCSKVPDAMMQAVAKGEKLKDDAPELQGDTFEQACFNDFWLNHKEILVKINDAADGDCVTKFRDWLLKLEQDFGKFGRKFKKTVDFKLVSNNPGYDISKINCEFFRRGFEFPVQEMFSDYVSVSDPSQQIQHIETAQRVDLLEYVTAQHDHWPLNDATQIYQIMCGIEMVRYENS